MTTPETSDTSQGAKDPSEDQEETREQTGSKAKTGTPKPIKVLAAWAVAGVAIWAFVNYVPDFVARHLVNSELEAMGIDTQGVKTLNLRPWNNEIWMGPVGLRPLDSDVKPAAVERIGVKYDLLELFQRRALITDMTITGIDIEIKRDAEGDFTINGIELRRYFALEEEAPSEDQPSPEDGERWGAGLDVLTLTDSRVFFDDLTRGTLTLEVDELKLEGFRTWTPDNPGTFELTGRLNDIDIYATGEARPFGDEITLSFATKVDRGSWEKVLAYTGPTFEFERQGGEFSSEGKHQLDITSDGGLVFYSKTLFTITDVVAARPDGIAGQYDKGVITLDTRTALDENGDMEVLGTTTYVIEGMRLTMPNGQVIDLAGVNAIFDNMKAEIGSAGTAKIRVQPAFVARGGALDGPATGSLDRLFIELGEVNVSTAGNRLSMNMSGSTGLESLSVSSPVELDLAALRMDLANVDVLQQGGALSIKGAATAEAGALKTDLPEQPGQPAIQAAFHALDVTLSDLSVDKTASALQWRTGMTLDTSDLVAVIGEGEFAKAKAGRVTLKDATIDQSLAFTAAELIFVKLQAELSDKLATAFGGGDKNAGSGESSPPPTVKLGRLAFVDGARILYEDTAVDPRVEVSVDAKTLEINNIDTGEPNQRTGLKVVAKVNEFANVDTAGWVAPLAANPTFELTANVQGLQLVAFSPYAAQAVGMHLESGTLSTRTTAAANQGKLKANVKLTLDDLDFSPVSPADAERLSAQVGIPVETAVAMLQDPGGAIRLELPVSGTTASPDIDLSQVIGKAIGGAFGTLVGGSGGKNGGVAFNPITFEAGSTALKQDGITLATSLAQMLKQRPKLSVDVCGRVTSQDLLAYANARGIALPVAGAKGPPQIPEKARVDLNKLAAERTRAVRQFVSTGHGIDPSRIEECRPTFDPADTGPPRVDIKM